MSTKYTATITLTDDGGDDVHVKCEFSGDGATDDSAAHRTAAVMMRGAIDDGSHDELVDALRLSREYVKGASERMYDGTNGHGIRKEALHRLALIDAALAKAGVQA